MTESCLNFVFRGEFFECNKKLYGYVTRIKNDRPQVLVVQHLIPEAEIEIPKGTMKNQEKPYDVVIREIK